MDNDRESIGKLRRKIFRSWLHRAELICVWSYRILFGWLIWLFSALIAETVGLAIAIGRFFKSLPSRIVSLGKKIAALGKRIWESMKDFARGFAYGNVWEKLSYFFMGFGNIGAGQYIKGGLFFLIEAGFVVFMALTGGSAFVGFFTLGTTLQSSSGEVDEWGTPIGEVRGDNSLLMLLFGVCTILIIIAFVCIYFSSIRSGRNAWAVKREGGKPQSFKQDVFELFDKKLYKTMLLIPILCVLAFTLIPLIYMILMAFTSYDHDHIPPGALFDWVGFKMFGQVFTSTKIAGTFFPVLGWTLLWALLATVMCYFGGILLALLINKKGIVGRPVFRTVFVLTIAIPQFITLLTMNNFLHIDGPLNTILLDWGITSERIDFLGSVRGDAILPRLSVLLVNLWIGVPYTMLITTGVLMNIPKDLYEAARIDGANPFTLFARITLPYVLFVTGPYLIQQFIGNINNFNIIYLLTGGGPSVSGYHIAGKTDLLITWLYKLTIEQHDYNLGAVIGIYTFAASAIFSLLAYSKTSANKNEGDFQV